MNSSRRAFTKRKVSLVGIGILIVLLISAFLWYFLVVDNIADEIVLEAGSSSPSAKEFLVRDLKMDIPVSIVTDLEQYDFTKVGSYDVKIHYHGLDHKSTIRVQDTQPPEAEVQDLMVFSYESPSAEDFIVAYHDATDCSAAFVEEPDMTRADPQTLHLTVTDQGGNSVDCTATLTILFDTEAPEMIGVRDLQHFTGTDVDLVSHIELKDNCDTEVRLSYTSDIDPETPGIYSVEYLAKDASGNESTASAQVTVIKDTEGPSILGVYPQSVSVGSTIAYRKTVLVEDDYDPTPKLTVDSSRVNLSEPGDYPLVYHATDLSGNETVAETTVTVNPKSRKWVDEKTIQKKVEEIAEKILTPDMDAEAQVRAIYKHVRYSYWYSGHSDKSDWKQAGYQLFTSGQGDCFSYFGASKLLFEYCGIPNIDVHRKRLPIHNTDHIWNMVSIDGGESYYYYDATPLENESVQFLLLTDEELDWYSYWYFDYFSRDRSILPLTPTESIR